MTDARPARTGLILPPLRRTARDAQTFARAVHLKQTDKAGRPYVEHVERVARSVRREMRWETSFAPESIALDEAVQSAWLHDILEPDERPYGPVTADDLRAEGFSRNVVDAAILLAGTPWRNTAPPTTYRERIDLLCIMGTLGTVLVKIADIEDNSDPVRLALLPEDVRASLLRRYESAKAVLMKAAEERGWKP